MDTAPEQEKSRTGRRSLATGALGVIIGVRAIHAHTLRGIEAVGEVGAGIWIRKDGIAEGY